MDKVIPLALRRESIDIIVLLMKDGLSNTDYAYSDNFEKQAYSLIEKLEDLSAVKK